MSTRTKKIFAPFRRRLQTLGHKSVTEFCKAAGISVPTYYATIEGGAPEGAKQETIDKLASAFHWTRAGLLKEIEAARVRAKEEDRDAAPLLRLPPGVPGDYRSDVVSLGEIILPILGKAPAGLAQHREDGAGETVTVMGDAKRLSGCFGVWVDGDSMIGERLGDGDLAIFRPQDDADDGDVVAVNHNDRVCIKRLRKQNGRIWLEPANDNYQPIEVLKTDSFRVLGVLEFSQVSHRRKRSAAVVSLKSKRR